MIDQATIVQRWHENARTNKRAFFDKYPEFIQLAQRLFVHWTKAAQDVPHTPWFEVANIQLPCDYMNYMEVLLQARPKVLIECGSMSGGSAAVWAEMMRRIVGPEFKVITIELKPEGLHERWLKSDPNIVSLVGDTTSPEIFEQVKTLIPEGWPVMASLDADHNGLHVCKEIGLYGNLVSSGQYMIVQDSFYGVCWGGNLYPDQCEAAVARGDMRAFDYHNCPLGAIEALLDTNDEFQIDFTKQRFVLTLHPFGWLRKK